MRCLSLWQPWASLIVHGIKIHETRSWPAPPVIIGKRIAIHAAKTGKGYEVATPDTMLGTLLIKITKGQPWLLPFGAIVCTAVVASCGKTGLVHPVSDEDYAAGDWSTGRYAWHLTDVRVVNTPMPVRGHQGVFNLPEDVVAALTRLGAV